MKDFVVRLTQAFSAIRGELEPREKELAEVRKAKEALGVDYGRELAALGRLTPPQSAFAKPTNKSRVLSVLAEAENLTIRDMILRALGEHFGGRGATQAQLREYFRDAYSRVVDRGSLSPQLAKLKAEGVVDHIPTVADLGEMISDPTSVNTIGLWKLAQKKISR